MKASDLISKLRGADQTSRVFTLLLGGGVAASVIPLAVSPWLTRLYTPAEMGAASIISTSIGVASTVITGRYEIPVGFVREDAEAANLAWVAIWVTALVVGVVVLALLVFPGPLRELLRFDLIGQWIWLLPAGLLFQGVTQTATLWLNRKSLFREIVLIKVSRSVAYAVLGIGLGTIAIGAGGIILGTVGGLGVAAGFSLWKMRSDQRSAQLIVPGLGLIGGLIRRFSEYPLYNASSSLLDSLSLSAPVFFLVHFFTTAEAGAYGLCVLVFGASAAVVMEAVTQTSLNSVALALRSGGRADGLVVERMRRLGMAVVVLLVPVTFFAPALFAALFGRNWVTAGQMAQIVAWVFAIRLVVSPFSFILNVVGWNRRLAAWKCCYFFLTVGVLYYASGWGLAGFLSSLLAVDLVSYSAYALLILRAARGSAPVSTSGG